MLIRHEPPRVQLVVIGDSGVGKTCLFISYTTNKFPTEYYIPTTFWGYSDLHTIDNTTLNLLLFDTDAQPEYEILRPLNYPGMDVVLICFSLVSPDTYENVRTKWAPEINKYASTAGVLLVGTKLDLREHPATVEKLRDRRVTPIQYQQGVAMCNDIKASQYLECSALTLVGVRDVFEEAMRLAINAPRPKKKGNKRSICVIA